MKSVLTKTSNKKLLFPFNNTNKNKINNINQSINNLEFSEINNINQSINNLEFNKIKIQEYSNGCRKIILNRPESLNSLNSEMTNFLFNKLKEYKNDDKSKFVILCSGNDKFFSSGGDLKELANHQFSQDCYNSILGQLYSLDNLIHNFNKPIISFVNGITMGSGVGLSIHCSHRIVGDNVNWSMPENKIGFFPDVGTSYFLSKLGAIGLYLGMTGVNIKSTDLIKIGLANNNIPNEMLNDAINELCFKEMINGNNEKNEIDSIINKYKRKLVVDRESSHLVKYRDIIERSFNRKFKSVLEIINHLKNEILFDNDQDEKQWAINTLAILESLCPTSVCISFENIHRSTYLNINQVFENEIRIGSRISNKQDFTQGVHKALIDKSHKPIFSPSSIYDINQTYIDSFFLPLKDEEKAIFFKKSSYN
ncbi:hypothetical protein ACTA71_010262 [Dictyostelium dimigraforme]